MKLLSVSILLLALAVAAGVVTKIVGHHTTCTSSSVSSGNSPYFPPDKSTSSCTRSPGLW
jgi:hypothetical protein